VTKKAVSIQTSTKLKREKKLYELRANKEKQKTHLDRKFQQRWGTVLAKKKFNTMGKDKEKTA